MKLERSLIQYVCACSLSCVQLFCDPINCSLPGSSVHGTSQARILEWVTISFFREEIPPDPSNSGIEPTPPELAGGFFTTNATWEAQRALLSFSSSVVSDSANPYQASLSFTLSRSLLKFMSIVSLMPSNHLILCTYFPKLLLILSFSSVQSLSCVRLFAPP